MFALKILKIFLLAAVFASACRFWQSPTDIQPAPPTPPVVAEIKSEIPFATKEPEVFQTEIVVTTNGGASEMFIARNGENRLTIFDYRTKFAFEILQNGTNGAFLIARNQKIYAEKPAASGVSETTDDFPTAELLNRKNAAVFQPLGAADGFAEYLVRLDESKNSEFVVTVDTNLNLPVKQEFYSVAGERKTLVSTTELKNFTRQTDAGVFDLPKDYKKVSPTELQDILRRERMK